MIIETSDNRFYKVFPTGIDGLDHVWNGFRMKQDAAKRWVYDNKRPTGELVRKAATRIVEQ